MFSMISKWASFVKFSHTVFALPFALASMVVAARDTRGWPGWQTFLLIIAAMICARTCAMAFNRIVDRKFDAMNPRTAGRHLPAGQISIASASTLCALSAAGLLASAWFLNLACFLLAPVALFFGCFYSLTKRFTDYTHFWLGVALALAPIGAWIAVKGGAAFETWWPPTHSFALPLVLAVAVVFWLVGFDIIYSLQDYEFDRRAGLHSLVVAWGPRNALRAAALAHLVMWMLLFVFGILLARFRIAYLVGMLIIGGSLALEHFLARRRSMNWVQNAFFRLNALVSLVFLIVTVTEVVLPGFRLRQ